jgi:16S rRNA processing protein RimM
LTDWLAAGVVRTAHGVRGELAVRSFSGSVTHLRKLRETTFKKGSGELSFRVQSVRIRSADVLLKLEGIDTREKAQELIGFELWVKRADAAPLLEGEYYAADLCRCSLYFGDRLIGRVRSVLDAGPNQLLEVKGVDGKDVLVPFIDHFIGEVDVGKGRISLKGDEIIK